MSEEDETLQTLFDMSTEDLRSLLVLLKPEIEEKKLNSNDIAVLRSKVTEWLLMNGLSTLHRFIKEDGQWVIPLAKSACDSCRKFQKEHKYTPSQSHPIINGENYVTLDIKSPENGPNMKTVDSDRSVNYRCQNLIIPNHVQPHSGCNSILKLIFSVSSRYYRSATECLTAFGNCLTRPINFLFSSCRNCCGNP